MFSERLQNKGPLLHPLDMFVVKQGNSFFTCLPVHPPVGVKERTPSHLSDRCVILLSNSFLPAKSRPRPVIDLKGAALNSGAKWDSNSLPRTWTWVAWMKTRNPGQQPSKGYRLELFFPGSLPPVKNTFLAEAETVKAGRKFITEDIAQQQVGGEYIGKWFL